MFDAYAMLKKKQHTGGGSRPGAMCESGRGKERP